MLILTFALLGLAVGSFLNLCIDRLPRGQSIIAPPSHCPDCGYRLGWRDLVPLLSYLWLRGRCRRCRSRIPLRIPIVELAAGSLFALLAWKFGPGLELGIILVYASLLLVIFVIDLEHQLVLNKIVYPSMVLALAVSILWLGLGPVDSLLHSLLGGVLGLSIMALPFLIYSKGMGMGDVKLAGLLGLMTGYPLIGVTLLLSVIAGGMTAIFLLAFRFKKRGDHIPFAPFLATAAMVTLLWGEAIGRWYMNLLP